MAKTIESDVLIIGGGGAAARAALEAHLQGSKVVMVMKGKFGECGATAYKVAEMAGYNVADGKVDPQDNPREHFKDICRAAAGMCDEGLAKILTEKALLTIPELEGWGVNFEKDGDGYLEVTGCFASRPRMHVIKGHSEPILAALKREIERRNIQILEFIIISDLLIQDGVCLGALGINERREFFVIKAKSTILATGGAGQLFLNNLNPPDITGDGYALGYRAGAEMVNMEFMQAGLGIIYPIRNILNSWVWLLHPRVYNKEGKEFLQAYLPKVMTLEECMQARSNHYPFSTYDGSQYIDIAVQKEILSGRGSEHGGVFLDFTKVDEGTLPKTARGDQIRKMWNLTWEWIRTQRGVDLKKQPVEVACFGHAINGGLKINERTESTLKGLYAVGEAAGGPHGADRLGGNMILTCQVFGRRAGQFAAEDARVRAISPVPQGVIERRMERVERMAKKKGSSKPSELKKRLQEVMWRDVLVIRSKSSLQDCFQRVEEFSRGMDLGVAVEKNEELWQAIELQNMLQVAEMMARAALLREESRGSHYREDFPKRDDETWDRSIITRSEDSGMKQWAERLPRLG